jgi:hypothetical protein
MIDTVGLLPTPSPEMFHPTAYAHPQARLTPAEAYIQQPSWETLRSDGTAAPSNVTTGMKRSHEYAVDDFFADVKKRRFVPSYDSRTSILLFHI